MTRHVRSFRNVCVLLFCLWRSQSPSGMWQSPFASAADWPAHRTPYPFKSLDGEYCCKFEGCANETAYYSSLVTFVASGSVDDYNETVQEQLMTSVAVLVGANATNIYINVTANVADGRRALSSASVTVQMEVRPEAMLSHSSR